MTNWDIFYSSSTTDSEEAVSDVLALSLNGEKHRVELSPPLQISFTHPKHVGYTLILNLSDFFMCQMCYEYSLILKLVLLTVALLNPYRLNNCESTFLY